MDKEKKTRLYNISLWIVITAMSISQLLNIQINLRLMQKIQSQEKAIHQLIDLADEYSIVHLKAAHFLQEDLNDTKVDDNNQ